jgi:hypothetical protein
MIKIDELCDKNKKDVSVTSLDRLINNRKNACRFPGVLREGDAASFTAGYLLGLSVQGVEQTRT